jgi:signal peptidase I
MFRRRSKASASTPDDATPTDSVDTATLSADPTTTAEHNDTATEETATSTTAGSDSDTETTDSDESESEAGDSDEEDSDEEDSDDRLDPDDDPNHIPTVEERMGQRIGPIPYMIAALVIPCVVFALVWQLLGGKLYTMTTPSMCPNVCVGSLIADKPLGNTSLHKGMLITFMPPGSHYTYTHQVYSVNTDKNGIELIQTKGVALKSPDPWVLERNNIVGVGQFSFFGLGYLLKVQTFIAVALAMLFISHPRVKKRNKQTLELWWTTAMIVLPVLMVKPFIRGDLVQTYILHRKGYLKALIFNTGLLSAQFHAVGGQTVGHVPASHALKISGPRQHSGYLDIRQIVSLYWWGWVIMVLIIGSPLWIYLIRSRLARRSYKADVAAAAALAATAGDEEPRDDDTHTGDSGDSNHQLVTAGAPTPEVTADG